MEKEYINAFNTTSWNVKGFNIEELISNFKKLNIQTIEMNTTLIMHDKTIVFNDENNPITYIGEEIFITNTLSIDKKFFENNKEMIIQAISHILKNIDQESINVPVELINDITLSALKANTHLRKITLGSKEQPYILDKKTYEYFKDSGIETIMTDRVSEELKDNFDDLIGYNSKRKLVRNYKYNDLINLEDLFIAKPLSEEELEYLRYIPNNIEVSFGEDVDYHSMLKVVSTLDKLNKNSKVLIDINDKNYFNSIIFEYIDTIKDANVTVKIGSERISLKQYLDYEKRLMDLVSPALKLSPFERYLFSYNIVKKFKKYKKSKNDASASRKLYKILDNEYMVCVGYGALLEDLLDKLGIESFGYGVKVKSGFDDVPIDAEVLDEKIEVNMEGHHRVMCNLVDEKYGIDGIFFADPTWDNEMEKDAYNHALMNQQEYTGIDRYSLFGIYNSIELLFSSSLSEFYQKINVIADHRETEKIAEMRAKNNNDIDSMLNQLDEVSLTIKDKNKIIVNIVKDIVNIIKSLDSAKYQKIINKYPILNSYKDNYSLQEIQGILLDVGEYVVSKTNTLIGAEKYKDAIMVLYSKCYGVDDENLESTVNEVMEYNRKRQELCFPMRYKITQDGEKIPIMNEINKFDLERQVSNNL